VTCGACAGHACDVIVGTGDGRRIGREGGHEASGVGAGGASAGCCLGLLALVSGDVPDWRRMGRVTHRWVTLGTVHSREG
jgi:hypothetical protein